MKRILTLALLLCALSVTNAHAVKHTGPTKKTVYSYNNSHTTPPKPDVEISRSEPSKPPVLTVRVEWDGHCLKMVDVLNGHAIWELCF